MALPDELKAVLANTFMLYYKAHAAHWNVEGMLFASLHAFFGKLYADVHAAVDPIAEHLRTLGPYAPPSLLMLLDHTEIEHDSAVFEVRQTIERLVAANDLVRASLYRARTEAQTVNQAGILNFLEGRIDAHDEIAFHLKAHLK